MTKNKLIELAFIVLQEDFLQKIIKIAIIGSTFELSPDSHTLATSISTYKKNKETTSFQKLLG